MMMAAAPMMLKIWAPRRSSRERRWGGAGLDGAGLDGAEVDGVGGRRNSGVSALREER